ncbi:NUDIX domain-containing protein [uncultured Friedmanniella sp.]|uniref:NUDIX hydrolase n=1 Tax=uncultured Friedmanniella sp. TaxID=335381 RepID=UPI0035CB87D9
MSHSWDVLGRLPTAVPPALAEQAAGWPSGAVPASPRRSSSVVLLRDAAAGVQTYLLHRHARMSFAASMVVFPGGGMDPADTSAADPLRACAVRETEEETGVRLAPEALLPWAHWVTPEVEPRRFDTAFYLAALPRGAVAADVSGETDRAEWRSPASALAAADRDELGLMPPTRSVLLELAAAATVAELLGAARDRVVRPVLPQLVRGPAGWRFRYPSPLAARLDAEAGRRAKDRT